uniref:Gypsy retrotransposon integrase-like protein 1 n=3 Tax=Oryzias latipes TaxID=8090 RepID=A0A3B3HAG4_ORYLA
MQKSGRNMRGAKDGPLPPKMTQEQPDEDQEENGASGGVDSSEGTGNEPSVADLVSIFRSHMSQQEARDARQMEESARQEKRFRALQHQFQLLQLEVQARTTSTPELVLPEPELSNRGPLKTADIPHVNPSNVAEDPTCQPSGQFRLYEPRLEKFTDNDDVEHYLITFERIALACQWKKREWVFHLIPLLTGKARAAYVQMDIDEALDYDNVKAAILSKFNINPENYRQRFRSLEIHADESPRELYARLKELYLKWIQPMGKTANEIGELIILEQYLRMLSPELQVWIREHKPESAAEAAKMAEVFVAARHRGQPWSYTAWKEKDGNNPAPQYRQRAASNVGVQSVRGGQPARVPICYLCGVEGHTKPMCPKKTKLTQMCVAPRFEAPEGPPVGVKLTPVEVNGELMTALIDTGSDQTLVHQQFISPHLITTKTIPVCCVHGDKKSYPTADVYIKIADQTYLLNVGVVDKLPFPVVLGLDLPVLFDLLDTDHSCYVAVTRARAKHVEPLPTLSALPFFDADLEATPGKSRKSRKQRRKEKFQHTAVKFSDDPEPELPLNFRIPDNIVEMQCSDPTLKHLFQRTEEKNTETMQNHGGENFVLRKGILYRQQGSAFKLVVPEAVREIVLTLGHSVPWAGHLGKHRTMNRIRKHFYWPGLSKDVAVFCKTCPQCQLTSTRVPSKAPLQPLPVISTPFERIGMDIVGPLERSKSGNRYMLVITDYATKYPEVFPLKTIKAREVAYCLVQFFSRVGLPLEILTDRGTNFLSTLLSQVYQLLGIKSLRTTAYHPQTDGLTERFNQTIKQMLRKFVNESGTDWDKWLPYLLFAYREVPQASTGFSPFELLYGHEVRGPLSLLKDMWEGDRPHSETVNVVSFVVQMRERLEKMSELAQAHMAEAQKQQKVWYDRSARQRSFSPGQKVLVLLPSSDSKLLTKWQGPFEVLQRIGQTTYRVSTPGQSRSTRLLHVNLLKEWVERAEKEQQVLLIRRIPEEDEVDEQYLSSTLSPNQDLDHLSKEQQLQVRALCSTPVFQENPGRTDIIQHDIILKDGAVVKRRSYRLPERLLTNLKEEVDLMLSLGVIEPSKSEWCSPVVLVPKKDGSIRFCIDFRYLNSVSKFDSYPTPRIDDLIERLGCAKYLTTIDLCKGYWQVPLTRHSRELTAFRTPWGLFQFTVLPFGLHGAPATFQRLMNQVLCGVSEFAAAYLDDIVIFSNTWDEHLGHLERVLDCLQGAGLTVNPSKCVFAKPETDYLGYIIGNGMIKPQTDKVSAIQSCPLPVTKKQLRSFLGMAGFYHRFIPHFSARAALLTDLTGARSPNNLQWTKEAEAAFEDIKRALSKNPVLYSPNFQKPFILQTDASDRGLGAVLLQGPPDDRHPVAFISRKLFPREVQYSTVEKEALGIKWALDSFKYYLLGREFTLETDHKALQWLARMKDTNGRITRWYLAIQPYYFTIHHIPGRNNSTADFISRCPSESLEGEGV